GQARGVRRTRVPRGDEPAPERRDDPPGRCAAHGTSLSPPRAGGNPMWTYEPPLEQIRFVLENVLDAPASWSACPPIAGVDAALSRQILDEAGRFAAQVLAPTNAPGDLHGCRLDR